MENKTTLFRGDRSPLADKLRPIDFSEYVGQEHILAKGKLLRRAIDADRLPSLILWGPPGSGKTTLAKIIARKTNSNFFTLSAVSSGVADAKLVIKKAEEDLTGFGKKTILFVDEIHRFNKAQQDIFLPYIENGTIIFIGATTENPSFEVNSPLLSRTRVFHLRELTSDNIKTLLKNATNKINKKELNLENIKSKISITNEALKHIAELCEGDARDAYNALELAILTTPAKRGEIIIDEKIADDAIQEKFIRYDKGSDGHYDAISALHKSLRASDIDSSLHYTARMLEAGEDPLYIVRRLVRFASEDIGVADPIALILATSCERAVSFVGMPEASLAIAEAVIYLANAPKSRAVDSAYASALDDVKNKRLDPIPLDIRNAPTKMMKDFGFGKGYEMYSKKSHLPKNLKDKKYWHED
ncbi:MAG: replication-associated recombination protein A [Patescibacteria group bacterium]